MKKLFALLLVLVLAFSLVACGTKETEDTTEDSSEETTEETTTDDTSDDTTEDSDVMSYADFMAADMDSEVTIECYVQGHQSWWDNTVNVYAQDNDGGYFMYNMACTEEDADKLVPGTKIKVTGYKTEWSGEVEIQDATFEFEDGSYVAEAADVTALLGTDDLENYMNQFVAFKGMTVEASKDADGNEVAYLYSWDGSGTEGDDLYFNVSVNGETYSFTVESYLCDKDSDVYKAVEALEVGQVIDCEGFAYWYNGINPHITSVEVVG